jgi:ABC-2 type transport system permease protein
MHPTGYRSAGAIFWAHWRTLRHIHLPRREALTNGLPVGGLTPVRGEASARGLTPARGEASARGLTWSAGVGLIWYALWAVAGWAFFRLFISPDDVPLLRTALPGGLLLMFLYWQVVPLLLATTGSSLDVRKLRAYPVPENQLFSIEILLRVTAAIEMLLVLAGMLVGALFNPALPVWSTLAALYAVFNLILAVGLRDLLARLLARRRVREIVVLLMVLGAVLPQLLLARRGMVGGPIRLLLVRDAWLGWPWTAAANLLTGSRFWVSLAVLSAWILAAYLFSSWQFGRTLRFDTDAAGSSASSPEPVRAGWRQRYATGLYRWPSWLLRDPLGALVEKELRSLARSPRFRLVYLMGLIFGCLMPLLFVPRGVAGGFFFRNYLTVVWIYALMLMSEVCFWNVFGFDRGAAQFYFLAPVSFARVLVSKNLTALFYLLTQAAAITAVSLLLRMPFDARRVIEACAAAAVVTILLFAAGNLLSVHQARGVHPGRSFRSGAAGRLQALLFAVYPLTFLPLALAYLARYAFDSQAALYAVLALDAAAGLVFYKVSLDSAVRSASRIQESILAALAVGDGPIAD